MAFSQRERFACAGEFTFDNEFGHRERTPMNSERNKSNDSASDATGIGETEDLAEESGAGQRSAMRRSEALVQRMEDAHWEELIGGSDGRGRAG
jgi:hypothetical protein